MRGTMEVDARATTWMTGVVNRACMNFLCVLVLSLEVSLRRVPSKQVSWIICCTIR